MAVSNTGRVLVAGLALSLAGFLTIADRESYVGEAMVPTQGDRPTLGLGSTFYEDGSPVRIGDKIKPVRALHLAANHIAKEERRFRASLPGVALSQAEYDIYVDWVYQYGTGAWAKSSMRQELLAGAYREACEALLEYRFAAKYDCSTMIDGQPNKRCWGVWTRQLERHRKCLEAQ
jgi:lysozyme